MNGDDIDGYISTFEYLATQAGWDPTADGTIEFFRRGGKGDVSAARSKDTYPTHVPKNATPQGQHESTRLQRQFRHQHYRRHQAQSPRSSTRQQYKQACLP